MLLLNHGGNRRQIRRRSGFTFQYASIKPSLIRSFFTVDINLHFNMLLLNPFFSSTQILSPHPFTFQYASIKPCAAVFASSSKFLFTFQYASIKPCCKEFHSSFLLNNLHFNMLLLNQLFPSWWVMLHLYLHFNMLLLNLFSLNSFNNFLSIYISICFY